MSDRRPPVAALALGGLLVLGPLASGCGSPDAPSAAGTSVDSATDGQAPAGLAAAGAVGTTAPSSASTTPTTLTPQPDGSAPATSEGSDVTDPTGDTSPGAARAPSALPETPADPASLAAELTTVEQAIRDPATPSHDLPDLGHRQQLAYRVLSRSPTWDAEVLSLLPDDLRSVVVLNVSAPREALGMFGALGTKLPAWRVVEPEPPDALLSYYREAEATSGVDWEVLAAINLVETAMGRIQGLSSAGAQGPMQFIPATWERWGVGDVTSPRDAIAAAARYLADRGAPGDYDAAIWAYNNHNNYVRAVTAYADVMRADERAFLGYYHWQVHHYSEAGDLWLRVGYDQPEPILATDWAVAHPDLVAGPAPAAELLGR